MDIVMYHFVTHVPQIKNNSSSAILSIKLEIWRPDRDNCIVSFS